MIGLSLSFKQTGNPTIVFDEFAIPMEVRSVGKVSAALCTKLKKIWSISKVLHTGMVWIYTDSRNIRVSPQHHLDRRWSHAFLGSSGNYQQRLDFILATESAIDKMIQRQLNISFKHVGTKKIVIYPVRDSDGSISL